MSFYLTLPSSLDGLAPSRLRRLLGIAQKQYEQAKSVGWPALEASWLADVRRIEAALA